MCALQQCLLRVEDDGGKEERRNYGRYVRPLSYVPRADVGLRALGQPFYLQIFTISRISPRDSFFVDSRSALYPRPAAIRRSVYLPACLSVRSREKVETSEVRKGGILKGESGSEELYTSRMPLQDSQF